MKDTAYLIMDRFGINRMTKRSPALARDEIAVGIRLTVPDSSFRSPLIMADLSVPEESVIVPEVEIDVVSDQ